MRSLITGVFGFVGKYLASHLADNGDHVLGTYCYEEPPTDNKFETAILDITDIKQCRDVINSFKPEVVYHLAGMSFVPDCEADFNKALNVNVGGTHNIFRSAFELKLPVTVALISSFEVYGRITPADLPVNENVPLRPANNYSMTKAMAELVAKKFSRPWYGEGSSIDALILRPANHIGPGQRDDFVASNFAHQLARIKLGKAPPFIWVGNLEAKRDFTDVRDIVRAYRLAALRGSGIYNLCSGRAVTIQTILETLIEISGIQVKIEQDPARMRPSDIREIYGDCHKARDELVWQHEIPLKKSLEDLFNYWVGVEQG